MQQRVLFALTGAVVLAIAGVVASAVVIRPATLSAAAQGRCEGLPNEAALKGFLNAAPASGGDAGGLFHGERMWGAVVNRNGELCTYATSTDDPSQVWPG